MDDKQDSKGSDGRWCNPRVAMDEGPDGALGC